jgi:Heterokaryon incompatibility protein (HET)
VIPSLTLNSTPYHLDYSRRPQSRSCYTNPATCSPATSPEGNAALLTAIRSYWNDLLIDMRVLNTTSFELRDFIGDYIPEYAILSHTWDEEEILLPDLLVHPNDQSWKGKKSFKKVSGFCSLASENGYEWCWIDTCCIDKTSSAELSEAINSMFRWYADSHVCYTYLSDVKVDHAEPENLQEFDSSRWHKRGWTLQELLAPKRVEFYDVDWHQIGTRFSLRHRISRVTTIRAEILTKQFDVEVRKIWFLASFFPDLKTFYFISYAPDTF